ncbi:MULTISPECIES: plasmid segregation protein ParM domain-containing protein [Enterococcus]|uniref:ParM/StbA family protein n=1 Tax=Enterococcus TaxID=1350 RepID=UPI000A3B83BA|nr:plasmid segregation protein ParM domain-containing protein [Enterococcus sp. 4E1_DIV0656]OTO09122.1 hypothetical protein A5882_003452 [Enterococcus sp. 4E1_DIV0656]
MAKKLEVFAVDLGNGFVKAKSSVRELLAPSNLAPLSAIGEEGLFEDKKRGETYHIYQQANDDAEYVWGTEISNPNFIEPNKLIETYKTQARYEQMYFTMLFEFVLAELASDFGETVDVVVVAGLPSSEVNTEHHENLVKSLKRKHLVTRDGVDYIINVKAVNIMEQPLGTVLDIYMQGNDLHPDFEEDRIAIVDFGAGTTILDIFQRGKRLEDSQTFREGMKTIYNQVLKEVNSKNANLQITRTEVEEAFKNGMKITYSKREIIDISTEADRAVTRFVNEMTNKIDAQLTDKNRIDVFILTGGGVNIVKDKFINLFGVDPKDIKTPENTQTAGVSGFYKLGSSMI